MSHRIRRLFGLPIGLVLLAVLSLLVPTAVSAADPPGWTSETLAPGGVARAHLRNVELRAARDGRLIAVAVRSSADLSAAGLTILERSPGPAGTWRLLAKTSWSDSSPSLALSAGGAVNVAFVRAGSGLRYTSNRTGSWKVEVVAGGSTAESPSLALTNGGTPSVAYIVAVSRTSQALRIASKTSRGWTVCTVATGDVAEPSLKIDQWSKRHVVYVRRSGSAPGLYYATDRSGSWRTYRLASARDVASPRLVLDLARHVHVTYERGTQAAPRVLHVTNATGPWLTTTASGTGGGSIPEIAISASGERPVIAYVAGPRGSAAPVWVTERTPAGGLSRTQATDDPMAGRPGLAPLGSTLHVLALRPFADAINDGELVYAARP